MKGDTRGLRGDNKILFLDLAAGYSGALNL